MFRSLDDRITSYRSYPATFKLRDFWFFSVLDTFWFNKIGPPEGLLQIFVQQEVDKLGDKTIFALLDNK